ncbi:hypothetical protein ZIOFF_050033 [Zingiber officinale]|uniref:SRP54-type proteins GTP-binding domain-containing protein n=1 Tax=Zingiber officinale TaxID=94328 RepID=A0A8J5FI84_ZINOF|nr:hypothetical protein ZIOFF_050033 [Zingiber officinale]
MVANQSYSRFEDVGTTTIFMRGGLILWELGKALRGAPIDTLISHSPPTLCRYLLAAIRREFSQIYDPKRTTYDDFDDTFRQLQKEAKARAEDMRKSKQVGGASTMAPGKKQTLSGAARGSGEQRNTSSGGSGKDESHGDSGRDGKEKGAPEVGAFDVNKLKKLRAKGGKKTDTSGGGTAIKAEPKKTVKENRVWDDSPSESKLDFTDPTNERGDIHIDAAAADQGKSMMDKEETVSSDEDEEEVENEKTGTLKRAEEFLLDAGAPLQLSIVSFIYFIFSISGNAVLEKSDLQTALKALKDRLMTKNVAEEIAEKLCESVAASLEGKKLGSFTRVSTTVHVKGNNLSKSSAADVHVAKEQGRPYVVVFVGVNGVGKSTNLAEVAYWLLQHNSNVMLAACDTFWSGAVEQLRTHARRLQIPIFEKGYEKDPALVAKEAIQEAKRNSSDVVLVDTAGRVRVRPGRLKTFLPDLVLFVEEALVGNDAVDQLTKFNQKLADLSTVPNGRLIDGILLTKSDTIDDKVGAALSMVYVSGAPVMFVGCGQSYTDLKKLDVKSIVKTLLK